MSMPALLLAMRDRLRASTSAVPPGLGYAEAETEVGWDGQPPPKSGQVFLSVHPGPVSEEYVEGRADVFSATVTLSMRLGGLPVDRWGVQNVTLALTGLYARAHAVAAQLHVNYTAMNAANAIIGVLANGFAEPLRFEGMSTPMPKGPEWWWAEDDPQPPVGLTIEIRFGQARRFQTYESQT